VRRKLSTIEQVLDGNVVYFVRLDGTVSLDRLRSAMSRVQGKHPALRALIHEERDGLYYEENKAPEIPLRIVSRVSEDDYRRECQTELHTVFAYDQPQLRLVWLKSERESDLLLTTSHRICDGMSIFILVKEVLRSLHSDEELVPYETPTLRDMIGGYQPAKPWTFKLKLFLMNVILGLIPSSRRIPENKEHHLEWKSDAALLAALKRRCKAEGVSVHAALAVALERSLFTVLGRDKSPKWIDNPMDIRREHFPALKNDTVFFAGGSFKLRIAEAQNVEFWVRARAVYEQMREQIEQEMQNIPGRFYLWERLRSVTSTQIHTIVRMGDALKLNGSWNLFALSNLGNIVIDDRGSPFVVKDLRIYMHSFTFRTLCLVTYTLHGEMRFYCVADDKCLTHGQAAMLEQEFMNLLQLQVAQREDREAAISNVLTAAAKSF
jgi:hypothetical protein